ncbi:MAG: hypothetical protein OEV21_01580 [Thermoplasmata archaeon]|nr:hypothetical protein [Thermoplasmata archaeon]
MAGREIRYQTIMMLTAIVAVVLISTAVLITGQSPEVQIFIVLLNCILIGMNVIGFFLVWGSLATVVDEVFVMTPSGMLLKHYSRRLRPDRDEDILAGMLTAVQNFVKESFDTAGGKLNEIRFENYDIIISYSDNLVLAAVISTKHPQKLKEKLTSAADEIEKVYGNKLRDWSGDLSELKDIDTVMKKLLGRV